MAWSQKQQLGLSTSDFEKGCRCFRVRYEYLPGDEHFERRKWQLCQDAFTGSQVQTLVGLRRAQAVQEVERLLQRSGKSSSAGDIEKWFRAGNLQQMSEKTIRAMLRIARRFATVSPEGPLIVAELDSKFQTEHCLSGHTNLDLLCSRTSIPKNSTLENGLLMWVLQSLREDIIKGSLDPNVGGQLLGSIVSMYLLKRRLVLYQVKKFGADHKAFGEAFSSMQTFLKSGLELQQASCLEWLRQAPDYLVEVVTFSAKVLKGHKAIDEVLLKLAMADPKMSPEAARICKRIFADVCCVRDMSFRLCVTRALCWSWRKPACMITVLLSVLWRMRSNQRSRRQSPPRRRLTNRRGAAGAELTVYSACHKLYSVAGCRAGGLQGRPRGTPRGHGRPGRCRRREEVKGD